MVARTEITLHRREAVKYWERRRLLYNAALAAASLLAIFQVVDASDMVGTESTLDVGALVFLGFLVLAANACYTVVYLFEFFVVETRFEMFYLRWRWVMLLAGCLFGGALAYACALSLFWTSFGLF